MISKFLSSRVLTVGCAYKYPKGGVAQVIYNYEQYVFPKFKCIINSGDTNKFKKLIKAVSSWLGMGLQILTDKEIEIIHIHTASYNSFKRSAYFVRLAKLLRKKVILHIHGGGFKEFYVTNPKWISSILNRCDAIITLSESWRQYYQLITKGPNIYIVENIVSLPEKKEVGQKDNICHLLFLGLIDKQKGVFDLLDVLHEHMDELNRKLILHIGGNGEIGKLQNQIKQYGLADMVIYEGFVSGEKKAELLSRCDAFILPSYTEGLPVSILEAMSYGKPILTTPVGGIPEIVKQSENGILFSPGDKENIYLAIVQILNNDEQRAYMGNKSLHYISPYFPDNVSKKLEHIYREI